MFGRKKKSGVTEAAPPQPGKRMKWYQLPQEHVDTVVFVHGILGHYVTTWGDFPKLLDEDPDLPKLDILLWGYRTGWFSRHHALATEGQHLTSHLESLVQSDRDLFLVGHSMGGLIILRGLVDRMIAAQAQSHPCSSIRWITLYASPLSGAWAAGVARIVWGWLLGIRRSLDKHLKDLSRGEFCTALMNEVVNRVYSPRAEDDSRRRIPIRLVVATNDGAVDPENRTTALAMYRDPLPLQLDEDHKSVKLPTHVGDVRYKALCHDLQGVFAQRFRTLCRQAIDAAATVDQREAALTEIMQRYGKIIRQRVSDTVKPVESHEAAENDFLRIMIFDGADVGRPPFDTVDRAMRMFIRRRRRYQ
jgi:pimeloyl-ACP methyl ester carboxylesterase